MLRHISRPIDLGGVPITWIDLSPLSQHWKGPSSPELGHVITGEVVPVEQQELIDIGCRELQTRSLLWPVMPSSGCTIGISVVVFNCQTFISGIRVVPSNQSYNCITDYNGILGFIDPSSETCFSIQATENLQGFEVAVKASGIVGLRILIKGVEDCCSKWVGDTGSGEPEVAFGRLIPGNGRENFAIAAGFDIRSLLSR